LVHCIKQLNASRLRVKLTEAKAKDWLKTMLEQVAAFKDKKCHTDLFNKTTQDLGDTCIT
jgi:hypothetical protein